MILRPLANFTGNGVLRGTIAALDDLGDPLGWEEFGNWSDGAFRRRAARSLAAVTDISEDRARALITEALREGRRQAGVPDPNQAPQQPEHDRPRIMTSGRYVREIIDDSWLLLQPAINDSPPLLPHGGCTCLPGSR